MLNVVPIGKFHRDNIIRLVLTILGINYEIALKRKVESSLFLILVLVSLDSLCLNRRACNDQEILSFFLSFKKRMKDIINKSIIKKLPSLKN